MSGDLPASRPAAGADSQGTARSEGEQGRRAPPRRGVTVADLLTLSRIPLAILFLVLTDPLVRVGILLVAAGTDLLDGLLARRFGGSRFGSFIDPVADKLFMLAAFVVVAMSGRLAWYEIAGVLLRDLVATVAFVVTLGSGRPMAIPARVGGKAVTVAQVLALFAFLLESPLLRPLAWATAAIALYAIADYSRAAAAEKQGVEL